MFFGVYCNQPVCLSVHPCVRPSVCPSTPITVCVSIRVQNTSFCQNAGRFIKSHLVAALVSPISNCTLYLQAREILQEEEDLSEIVQLVGKVCKTCKKCYIYCYASF